MGIGDDIIATSFAVGVSERLVAFGDGKKIIWGPYSEMVFRHNPKIARPGQEQLKNLKWVPYYKGHRIYNKSVNDHWEWNLEFKVKRGELFFSADEIYDQDEKLILIEPNLPNKTNSLNKEWPLDRWRLLTNELGHRGWKVRQFGYGGKNRVVTEVITSTFRQAAGRLLSARLAILPEGGLHHAAAAVGTPAVVLFGGFAPPVVLGYDTHVNLVGTGLIACGSFRRCSHCIAAMNSITVDDVLEATERLLQ